MLPKMLIGPILLWRLRWVANTHLPRPRYLRPTKYGCQGSKGWMNQDAIWYGDKARPRRRCVRWGRSPHPPKRGTHTHFSAHVYCGQTAGWMKTPLVPNGSRPRPRKHCVRRGCSSPVKGAAQQPPPLLSAHVYCRHGRPSQLLLSSCIVFSSSCMYIMGVIVDAHVGYIKHIVW